MWQGCDRMCREARRKHTSACSVVEEQRWLHCELWPWQGSGREQHPQLCCYKGKVHAQLSMQPAERLSVAACPG